MCNDDRLRRLTREASRGETHDDAGATVGRLAVAIALALAALALAELVFQSDRTASAGFQSFESR